MTLASSVLAVHILDCLKTEEDDSKGVEELVRALLWELKTTSLGVRKPLALCLHINNSIINKLPLILNNGGIFNHIFSSAVFVWFSTEERNHSMIMRSL